MEKNLSLYELNCNIKEGINNAFSGKYNIVAEISEINESRGHAYLELIEKDENDQLLAKARSTIWANTFRMLKPYFETTTGHKLESGLKILIVVKIEFHEIYGYSLNILDIDPTYTIGDIEQKRIAIIKCLENEGVFDMNKELIFPAVPQKIAVISSKTAAGYGDFIDQLHNNETGYIFYTKLFPAAMQGEDTENSIINALDKIFEYEDTFDIVIIIRGGGSKSDLSWFDSYDLAVNIAQFPLPVLTGIGHEKDVTIADMVAHYYLKTPTAVAEFLVSKVFEFDSFIDQLKHDFFELINDIIIDKKNEIERFKSNFKPIVKENIFKNKADLQLVKTTFMNSVKNLLSGFNVSLEKYPQKISSVVSYSLYEEIQNIEMLKLKFRNEVLNYLKSNKHILDVFISKNNLLNPDTILERGYSLTTYKGCLIKSIDQIKNGDIIKTKVIDGNFKSKVEN